jgi:hypothetical protein
MKAQKVYRLRRNEHGKKTWVAIFETRHCYGVCSMMDAEMN